MGLIAPPYYGVEDVVKKIEKIAKLDEKINELLVERESYVEDLKEAIAKENSK